ncbi:MAG TPA: SDR family NAD(P)-dependent oxidoreductase [Thermoanaerobaculia bacterium]|nr:SDR family NAD(P)-dependent oxidoreductase [Thermoanaerobaculia bacterium]HUM29280.1 SDR family NAD(P)-dependent oxidoreductase [Thermoanaerobaculia bacterium]HXK67762.1 SDR family NAD(P)-dependent oxidoreductase [Thermoanaerobaculia bacterium]
MAIILVTGASSGIGEAFSRQSIERGDNLVLVARRSDRLLSIQEMGEKKGSRVLLVPGDVRNENCLHDAVDQCLTEFGTLDAAVSNAGLGLFGPVDKLSNEQNRTMVETNIMGTVNLLQAVLPHFRSVNRGHFMAVASIAGLMGYAGMAVYSGTKFAVVGLMEALAGEFRATPIRFTAICPGEVETEFFDHADRSSMPAAAGLIRPLKADQVARTMIRALASKKNRVVLPWTAAVYVRFHQTFPGMSRWVFYRISDLMRRRD